MTIDQPLKIGFELNSYKIESTSVTRYKALQDCKLKGVLDAKGETKLLAYSINNELGILIHELMEDSLYEDFPNTKEKIKTFFEEMIAKKEQKLKSNNLLSPFLPFNKTDFFAVKKLRAVRNAFLEHTNPKNTLLKRSRESSKTRNRAFGPEVYLEITDTESNIKVTGKIDKVSIDDDGQIVLTDYKSGEILDEDGELKISFKDQLEIYAAIYLKQFGKSPSKLIVENLKQKNQEWIFDETTSMELLKLCIQQIIELNKQLSSMEDSDLNELLCDTSESGCKFCPYKPKCNKFIKKIESMDKGELIQEKNIYGKFIQAKPHKDPSINIVEIESNGQEISIWTKDHTKHPDFNKLAVGTNVGFFNLKVNQGKFVEKISTRSYFYE